MHHASPRAPGIHTRAALTWLAIFPLVTLGTWALAPLTAGWPLPLGTLALTLVVVPLAVYLVVPALLSLRVAILRRGTRA
ncbi:hypothetical protein [Mycetocola spongiae]|uniref:hypothetical protein n=1 Tax=Mycetocola spongiae TaxID=2859226 RepID=UPI001CF282D0|nr:hypothetical protein [Mycetocola spongiae]UCR90663.1 hypothetical protein KXZ72_13525 [Mycetocola spongiae]